MTHGAEATRAANYRAGRTAVVALTVNAGDEVWIFGGYARLASLIVTRWLDRALG